MTSSDHSLIRSRDRSNVDVAVAAWLKDVERRSAKTHRAYEDAITSFRQLLWSMDLDLDAPRGLVRTTAQEWAATPRADGAPVAPATYNQRLAIVGSFFTYAINADLLDVKHPTHGMKPMKNEAYQSARPIPSEHVEASLAAIDRSDLIGKRDYALLMIALTTGRRLSELRGMNVGHVTRAGSRLIVEFPHAKGGKVMRDELAAKTASALKRYLSALYGAEWATQSEAPVWVSFSDRSRGHRLSRQSIAEICLSRLGISKVHALRHTFAHEMERQGAPASLIQAKLGHSSLETTGRYLRALDAASNPFADKLAQSFDATSGDEDHE